MSSLLRTANDMLSFGTAVKLAFYSKEGKHRKHAAIERGLVSIEWKPGTGVNLSVSVEYARVSRLPIG